MKGVGEGMHVQRIRVWHWQAVVIVGRNVAVRCGFRRERSAWRWAVDTYSSLNMAAAATLSNEPAKPYPTEKIG